MRPVVVSHVRVPRRAVFPSTLLALAFCACSTVPTELDRRPDVQRRQDNVPTSGTPLVRISQVYGGGGNTGAPYTNDFIELYNAGDAPQSLTGWSVQYASATGTGNFASNPVVALGNLTLQPGQYFLVQLAGGANGAALPTPDVTSTINMSGTAGKAVLVKSATGLACNGGSTVCSSAQLALIEDLVGYGNANFREGTAVPTLSNTTAALRKNNGATDTQNNSADFEVGAPNPRNSAAGRPAVTTTTPATGATGVALSSNLTVTFNRAVAVSGAWYTIACTSGTRPATVTGGATSFTINPDADFTAGDACTVTIVAAQVASESNPTSTMAANYVWSFEAGAAGTCDAAFTSASAIQGNDLVSPLAGQSVTTQGVVVGDFEGASPALRGFYLQDVVGDGDPATSDAVFVFNGENNSVSVGDVVRVTGTVAEFQGQTQVSAAQIVACGNGTVVPADVTMPVSSATALERFEGMLVRFPQTLTVTEHFQLGRFGQIVLSSGGRLAQPTNVVAPGAAANALQAQNDLRRIILDDALQNQNTDPIVFGRGGNPLSASNTLRGGDEVSNVTGVLTYTWSGNAASGNAYRVRPVGALGAGLPMFVASNPRPTMVTVGGSLRVAGMNVLNYFNTFSGCTNGAGGPSTDCRGADNATEFTRQRDKIIAAILSLGADVVGVNEIENDGYGSSSAIQDLVNGLNAATAPGTWSFVDADAGTGEVNSLGTDAIKVGLLYRSGAVTPVGRTAALNSTAFVNSGDPGPRNRPALAQAFEQPNRARVVVVINHLKSKGSNCAAPDAGDGQGNCNVVRANAALLLKDWLATDPTDVGESRTLIMGDLNSYAKEDPITVLLNAGYVNLADSFLGAGSYSYVFDGQWGSLDHALGSPSIAAQVAGVVKHHINADEPSILDYNTNFKTAGLIASLYAPDQYRSADHDPVVVGLNLVAPSVGPYTWGGFLTPTRTLPTLTTAAAGFTANVRFSLSGNMGLGILKPGNPLMRPVNCTTLAPLGSLASTTAVAPLAYVASTASYSYFWRTDRTWAGSCRELVLRFIDGSQQRAVYRFQ
ncbi:ExeM/NucH family extracellular endonuclease [Gemmatimonas sp.]|uniref:ExeM/NucH family extracellular endonuclease n=1 Tax=Gemmatimonas sp. TaxID=1962908 RepID=UPI0037BEB4AF